MDLDPISLNTFPSLGFEEISYSIWEGHYWGFRFGEVLAVPFGFSDGRWHIGEYDKHSDPGDHQVSYTKETLKEKLRELKIFPEQKIL